MNKTPPAPQRSASSRVSTSAVIVMLIVLATLVLLAIFANVQRLRQNQVETVVVRWATPSASPAR